jgi:FtsZ-binding cell division protein ZapB
MSEDDVQAIVDMALQDKDVKEESARALAIFNNSDFQTIKQTGQYTLVRTKALEKGLETAVDTITKVSIERDHYKEMIGAEANQQSVQDMIANKYAKKTRNDRNRLALTEIQKMLEQNKAVCKTSEKPKSEQPVKTNTAVSHTKQLDAQKR